VEIVSKVVIAFCTAQATGQKAHAANGTWSKAKPRERRLFITAR